MTSLDSRTSHAAPVPAVSANAVPVAGAVPAAVSAGHGEHVLRRGVAAVGLLGIALIHVVDVPDKLEEVPYLGVAYLGLIAVSLVVAEMLVRRDDRRAWALSALLSASVILGYVVNRTTGMPGAMDDIGNWLEPLGVASLFVEGVVLAVSGIALVRRPGRR
ncbi:hypothetical protein [Kineosporia sp. A_224]|uniref:hypothetical protein n=1 Tax=Kineosporia sp. A_224 TaxID=1962180 RepID=UPI000B4BE43A|nr:hypothetical protein [Kineosporia sp. A_224]